MNQDEQNKNIALQKTYIPEENSKRITSLRFLLIVLVVFIHNNFTVESIAESIENGGADILFVQNAFGKWIQLFITQGIARCAVPLFFLFAAYLQGVKNDDYRTLIKKKTKSLFMPFIIRTAIYGFYFAGLKLIVLKIAPQFIQNPQSTALSWAPIDWIHKIFGYKLKENGELELPGFAYQFWFIRDLIILIVISPVLKFCIKKFPIGFFILITILFLGQLQLYFIAEQALFFYCMGLYWAFFDFQLFKLIDKITWFESAGLFLFTFIVAHVFYNGKGIFYWFMVLSACIIFLKISKTIVIKEKIFNLAQYLAGFSFFLFAIHTPLLNEWLKKLWLHFFPMKNTFFSLFEYFGVAFLNICIGTGSGIVMKKIFPKLFYILIGGRK